MTADSQDKIQCLLIDDNEADNFIHKRAIMKSGLVDTVKVVHDGDEGLLYLKQEGDFADSDMSPKPDLIFLDINMPRVDGFEFVKRYQEIAPERKADICIIMLSTSENPADFHRANELEGVDGFIQKPLTMDLTIQTIKDLIERRKMS